MKAKKHITLFQRRKIEQGLNQHQSIRNIALMVDVNHTTISREIYNHRVPSTKTCKPYILNNCASCRNCQEQSLCLYPPQGCKGKCSACTIISCNSKCPNFKQQICETITKAPWVCNGCTSERHCPLSKFYYIPEVAEKMHHDLLVNSRKGISATPEELKRVSDIIYEGNQKGQSLYHITNSNRDEIPWSLKTSYNYNHLGFFRTKYHDLPIAPTMKKRKKKSIQHKVDTKCLEGRSYTDYKNFIAENPNAAVVELDSVIGRIGGKVLLTMNFNHCGGLMLAFIRDFNTSQSVIDVFSMLENKLGLELFQKLFPVFLTDNGGEFTNPVKLETSIDESTKRTTIFYCDPYSSWQKGRVENNHKNLRKILPKGTSFDNLTQEDIDLVVSHVNSLSRQSLNGKSSYEVFSLIYGTEVLDQLNVKKIAANDVILIPELLSNK